MTTLLLLLWAGTAPAADEGAHEKSNPVYKRLCGEGVALSARERHPLLAPTMPDGLDGRAQLALIKNLLPPEIELENFLDDLVTAPQLFKRPAEKKGDPPTPVRSFDLYFVAYGDLDSLADTAVLERLVSSDRRPGKPSTLTAEQLKSRGIVLGGEAAKHEGYRYLVSNILVRVQVRAVGHFYWSRSADSILVAAELDERFAGDAEFPNQWRALIKEGDEEVKEGPPHPYRGAGYYVKITRLKEPAGALFVEAHVVFAEPAQWFNGENVLRSKLPAGTLALVRHFRRETARANNKGPGKE